MATSAYFEVRLDDETVGKTVKEKDDQKKPNRGGMSFSVGLAENDHGDAPEPQHESNLQLAARLHRIKSEMRRSNQKSQRTTPTPPPPPEEEEEEETLQTEEELQVDDLIPSEPSETGTYTLRLDSAEVRERKNLVNITQESLNDQNSATESADQDSPKGNSAEPEFEIPTAVSARITEWFNRNDAANESRASECSTATDSNLEDIREKAKNRIKERNQPEKMISSDTMDDTTSNITTSSIQVPQAESSKIVISREERKKDKPKKEPQVRLTRAMLLRKNRALGIKGDESPKSHEPEPKPSPNPKAKRISTRLDNLSKPKRVSEVGVANKSAVARQRSFSHDDHKVQRGRTVAKPQESSKGPAKTNSRSTSLTRKNSGMAVSQRQDILSRSVRSERVPATQQKTTKRSTSLTRSSTVNSLKVKQTPKATKQPKPTTTQRITSSSSSSRPGTAQSSVRDSHENSILYSLNIISGNCLTKTKEILGDMVGDMSELNAELDKMTTGDCVDLEALFGRICALDKCLGRVRAAQKDGTPVLANLNNATMENTNTTQHESKPPSPEYSETEITL